MCSSDLYWFPSHDRVRELFKARDYETLTTDYVVNKKGVRRPVFMSDAYYSQFAVKFTGSACFNVAETSSLFVRWYTLPAVSSLPKAKFMMTGK